MTQVSPLRCRMIEDMTIRNLSPATQQSYVYAVSKCQSARKKGSYAFSVQLTLVPGARMPERDDSPRGHQSWTQCSHSCLRT